MKKTYALLTVLSLWAVGLFAQAPAGYMEKGALLQDFSTGFEKTVEDEDWGTTTTEFCTPYGWTFQKGTPSKSYKIAKNNPVNGKYLAGDAYFLQTAQTTPTMLITPLVNGLVTFYIKPSSISEYAITNRLATNQSWVKIYGGSLNAEGTIDWNYGEPLFTEVFTAVPEGADSNGWVQRSFSVSDYKFLGIQMSYAGFDELTAENYYMPIKKVLKPLSITSDFTDDNPLYGDAEGNATWIGKVTVKNEGDESIEANTAKLTLKSSATYAITTTMTEFVIPETLAPNDEKTFDLSVPVQAKDPTKDARTTIVLTSNINSVDNTELKAASAWFTIKTRTPNLVVKNANGNNVTSYETSLGLLTAPASTTFTLDSKGGSAVVLKSITSAMTNLSFTIGEDAVVFPLEIAAGESKVLTMHFGNTGGNAGTLTFTYGNIFDETTYTVESKSVSAVVADPALYLEDFAANLPQGWINETGSNWSIKDTGGKTPNYYMDNGTNSDNTKYLISPKLHFEEGQTLSIMVLGKSSSSHLTVLTSADRNQWTEVAKKDSWSQTKSSFDASKCEMLIVNMPVGDCYVAFESGYTSIDYILGGKKVDVEDDFYTLISGKDNGMVNYQYELAVSIQNLMENNYEDKAIALELISGDKVVATDTLNAIAALANDIKDTLRFTPHVAGKTTLSLNVKKGDVVLATLTKQVTIAEEIVISSVTTGEQSTTNQYVPFRTNYCNSKSEFIYTTSKIGLPAGTNLTSITFNYYNISKDITGNVKIWLQNTADEVVVDTFTDVTTMTCVFEQDNYVFAKEGFSSACVEKTFTFTTPFEYQGGNLRVVLCSEQQPNYGTSGWGAETVANSALYKCKDNYTSYLTEGATKSSNLPVAKLGFAKEIPTISGEVTLADGSKAGPGKKIEAKSGEVIYSTTTTEEGTYSIVIMQSDLTYELYLEGKKVAEDIVLNETTLVDNTVVVNIIEPGVGTDYDQISVDRIAVRKVFNGETIYIQRGEHLYNLNGQVIK